jgi:hypothetical protein
MSRFYLQSEVGIRVMLLSRAFGRVAIMNDELQKI